MAIVAFIYCTCSSRDQEAPKELHQHELVQVRIPVRYTVSSLGHHAVVAKEMGRLMEVVSFGGTDLCVEKAEVLLMGLCKQVMDSWYCIVVIPYLQCSMGPSQV